MLQEHTVCYGCYSTNDWCALYFQSFTEHTLLITVTANKKSVMVISYSNRKSGLQFGKKNSRNVCHSVEKKHSLAHVSICKRLIKEMKPEPDRWDYSSRSVRSGDKKIK